MSKNKHIGSSFDDFLSEEGQLEQATAIAVKRVIAWQIEQAMQTAGVNKSVLAKRMQTSPDASLNSDSPAIVTSSGFGAPTDLRMLITATGSVGEMSAPNRKQ